MCLVVVLILCWIILGRVVYDRISILKNTGILQQTIEENMTGEKVDDIMEKKKEAKEDNKKIAGAFKIENGTVEDLYGWKHRLADDSFNKIFEGIPERYKKNLDVYFVEDHYAGGSYFPDFQVIFVNIEYEEFKEENILWHELGHHWWYTELTDEEKERFAGMYWNKTSHITPYASTRVEEDFAEIFACGFDKSPKIPDGCSKRLFAEEIEFLERTVDIDIEAEGTNSTEGRFINIVINQDNDFSVVITMN